METHFYLTLKKKTKKKRTNKKTKSGALSLRNACTNASQDTAVIAQLKRNVDRGGQRASLLKLVLHFRLQANHFLFATVSPSLFKVQMKP